MRKFTAFVTLALLLSASSAFAGRGFPLALGGFTLGENVHEYASCCDLKLASPMPDSPFLTEMHLKPDFLDGVRGGSLTYANCKEKDKLVRIKLKFHNRGQALFEDLLARYKAAFGDPDSYQGDTFRNVIAWQWDFTKGDRRVSVLLMWSRDKETRPGVSIKMTLESAMDAEYACFRERMDQLEKKRGGPSKIKDLNAFVPR
ncbi:hypothetical protein [Pseudodesulfovibrio sp.]|uniref:hypothetical protein n=1 Tax=Pseudodesulfovibrio sp. TaxID=2035812 RepID=UPI00260A516C|nr:hypothetical protein [Pseudodesulfovibrio sp.]MDD3312928.1 hypothetical protein [Pseudodesulfovibrio sp.]